MADALCGPSNALQNFQKHTSVDRTLQQDRLRSRQPPSQGFRSPEPHAGFLDPEFEAFQAGLPAGPPQADFQHFSSHFAQQAPVPSFAAPSNLPNWASDFQRLQISSPQPSASAQRLQFAPQSASAAWHQDFLQQHTPSARTPVSHAAPLQPMYSGLAGFPMQTNMGMSGMGGAYMSSVAQGKQREEHSIDQFDDAAFKRAFDAARAEMLQEELTMADAEQLRDAIQSTSQAATNHLAAEAELQASRSLEESLKHESGHEENFFDILAREEAAERLAQQGHAAEAQEQRQQQQQQQQDDGDELAHTAGQLLNSVADNTSKKFQESRFLALMRRLRDREVRVEGDKMVEVSGNPAPSVVLASTSSTTSTNTSPSHSQHPVRHLHTHIPSEQDDITCKVFGCDVAAYEETNTDA